MSAPAAAAPATEGGTTGQLITFGLLAFAIMMIDGYDIGAMPIIVPRLAEIWGVPPQAFGPALSAVVIGLGVGAFLFAPIGDRLGRRLTTVTALLVISLATLGTASAGSLTALFWWRLITGIGLGACLPNMLAILAQVFPPRRRASAMTLVATGIPLGAAGSGAIVPMLTGGGNWQAAFSVPAYFMFGVTVIVWLALRTVATVVPAPEPRTGSWSWTDIPVFAPLRRGLRTRTAIFATLFCFNSLAMYILASWLPTMLGKSGFSFETASHMASLVQLGGLFGGLVLAVQIDRQRTIPALLTGYIMVALCLVVLALTAPSQLLWSIVLLLVGCGIAGAHIALPAVAANIYPSAMLSAAIGLAVTIARLGAMGGPMAGAVLIGAGLQTAGFFLVVVLPVAVCGLCILAFARARLGNAVPADPNG